MSKIFNSNTGEWEEWPQEGELPSIVEQQEIYRYYNDWLDLTKKITLREKLESRLANFPADSSARQRDIARRDQLAEEITHLLTEIKYDLDVFNCSISNTTLTEIAEKLRSADRRRHYRRSILTQQRLATKGQIMKLYKFTDLERRYQFMLRRRQIRQQKSQQI